ncbi:MAG: hypothetical protein JNK52_12170 [Zoogloeaceae bacterium]|nr:hypothetical protein [Zoogloeaceae bacterium]
MSITLSAGGTTLTLDPDLLWADEFEWAGVEQSVDRSVTGAMIIQAGSRLAGRPITLQPEDDSAAWMPRADMAQLQAWADVPGQVITLTLRGVARLVMFRHHDGGAFSAKPVVHFADPDSADWLLVTLRFMTVPE